jgi:hypothetical protein
MGWTINHLRVAVVAQGAAGINHPPENLVILTKRL